MGSLVTKEITPRCTEPVSDWMPLNFACARPHGHPDTQEHVWVHQLSVPVLATGHMDDVRQWSLEGKTTRHLPEDCHLECLSYEEKR